MLSIFSTIYDWYLRVDCFQTGLKISLEPYDRGTPVQYLRRYTAGAFLDRMQTKYALNWLVTYLVGN
jgi:hypothetical protein